MIEPELRPVTPGDPAPPASCGVAFKEWAGVCRALGEGRQTVLLRKGGIAESGGVFAPEHPAFWLFPTRLHEAEQGLRGGPPAHPCDPPPAGFVELDLLAVVQSTFWIADEAALTALRGLHAWTDETVAKKFGYRVPGVWVLGVRLYRRPHPVPLAVRDEWAGCKTWVPLPVPISTEGLAPVLDDEEAGRRREELEAVEREWGGHRDV